MSEDEIVALLAVARETQRARVAGHTGDDVRYEALMVANALAIAERWIRAHVQAERNERDGLAALYPDEPGSVRAMRKLLAREIRGGVTGKRLDSILALVAQTVDGDVAVANPRALAPARPPS